MMDRAPGGAANPAARVGVGLRGPHEAEVLSSRPAVGWFEVHPENYMEDGPATGRLLAVRRDYPVSLHGVGLSLGSAEGIGRAHLRRLKDLAAACEPFLVSEHLSWSVSGGIYLNDLLPLPYTDESLDLAAANVAAVQEELGRRILVENPSSYLRYRHSTIPEPEFLAELARRTGCGLLCDVNNIYVSAFNHEFDPLSYLQGIPPERVRQFHLAGHRNLEHYIVDTHDEPVADPVWQIYEAAVRRFGRVSTMIERDDNIPPLAELLAELGQARRIAEGVYTENAA